MNIFIGIYSDGNKAKRKKKQKLRSLREYGYYTTELKVFFTVLFVCGTIVGRVA